MTPTVSNTSTSLHKNTMAERAYTNESFSAFSDITLTFHNFSNVTFTFHNFHICTTQQSQITALTTKERGYVLEKKLTTRTQIMPYGLGLSSHLWVHKAMHTIFGLANSVCEKHVSMCTYVYALVCACTPALFASNTIASSR